ncbi:MULTISPECIES: PP2C family protein-serine/threonine phosphatase [unclassified Frankia]|uniref:PP2C family protein-serine/threonine phosphatase n=1 Tax=unclassified Frankia TaxID=2632575 RepID=UPI001EE437FB|nr:MULTISPECIES: PP2C family protein-serine/threonine phosphatase [unclassified Frankia]
MTLVAVMGVELSNRTWTYIGYTVLVPMVAANLAGPRVTSVFAGLALAAGGFSIWWEHLWDPAHGGLGALTARIVGILVGGAMAVLASRYNTGRETKLANITQVADTAQRAILSDLPATSAAGLRLAVRYESAATEASVGGDLYEMIDSPWGTRLMLGDARGKGLDAVRLASRVLGCFRVVARMRADVRAIVPDLDAEVASVAGLDDFVTGIVAEFGPDSLTLVNAGHPDPVLVRDGLARLLAPPERQPPLGLGARSASTFTVPVRPGDRLLFYTDGIAEAREPRTRAFFPLLPAVERALGRAGSLDENLARLVDAVQHWTGSALQDDVALLVAEVPAGPLSSPADRPGAAAGRRGGLLHGWLGHG